ncbi:hypothetical protein ACLOJK_030196 [Asimina triloba]
MGTKEPVHYFMLKFCAVEKKVEKLKQVVDQALSASPDFPSQGYEIDMAVNRGVKISLAKAQECFDSYKTGKSLLRQKEFIGASRKRAVQLKRLIPQALRASYSMGMITRFP